MRDLQQARLDTAMDITLAITIGCALAGVLVMWWST